MAAIPSKCASSLSGGKPRSVASLQGRDEVGDHGVILLKLLQGRREVRVCGGDGGEQLSVFAFMVAGQRGAEAVAEQQQLTRQRPTRLADFHRGLRHAQCFAESPVDGFQFVAPGDEPVLSHERAKEATSSSSYSFRFHASMPDTACHQHATLTPGYQRCHASARVG